ncbi:D-hexose-6-phosphate mutarotase [Stutzerimonas zhaodongensis]|jgi:glucose-6-phosphate 1-epimerase|uniref:D-hexose-6-phosphate mutarotase n=1 Tax=Stutzerimonas zhaodongensis TaxID=1176257 RepID=UPI001F4E1F53|nr:D-hexose-6-phosphate mutarotase [Stutzerimonas zhaodongensis]UNG18492.1 D-hexose-6-phosphate mutarotase [Stutzerimonas zhaodongensis]
MPVDIQRIEKDQLSCWRLRHGDAEVIVAEQGAQVLSYRQGEAAPIIWLSEEAAFQAGQAVRGGVPVCWPWFGDLARNPQSVQDTYQGSQPAPAHGLVRNIDWLMARSDSNDESVTLVFACNRELPGWPHAVELSLKICLDSKGLHLSLTSHNRGDTTIALSQALHGYFAISDIHQVTVEGLDGRPYIETLDDWQQRQQQGDLVFGGETDRIYLDLPSRLSLRDPDLKRQILLETRGSRSAILWNPWIAKAQRLSQFADDAWQRMLCIETANVMDDVIQLEPSASHTLSVSISAESI